MQNIGYWNDKQNKDQLKMLFAHTHKALKNTYGEGQEEPVHASVSMDDKYSAVSVLIDGQMYDFKIANKNMDKAENLHKTVANIKKVSNEIEQEMFNMLRYDLENNADSDGLNIYNKISVGDCERDARFEVGY